MLPRLVRAVVALAVPAAILALLALASSPSPVTAHRVLPGHRPLAAVLTAGAATLHSVVAADANTKGRARRQQQQQHRQHHHQQMHMEFDFGRILEQMMGGAGGPGGGGGFQFIFGGPGGGFHQGHGGRRGGMPPGDPNDPSNPRNIRKALKAFKLDESASEDVVKRTYRQLAKKYHPDKCHEPTCEEKMIKVNKYYEILQTWLKNKAS
ncbi:hypothetical protein AMAG_02530 [Allomyces macrogynus ATCC 38327]|uniref:J domain-containing protein n=1 Tax=Allomyces macrogynus (strain ATCC 38327) TaxID=578462 RepID=A0A0L0S2X2_ALLM3|nr:hypothetical protein AMAG_02530 [Allomyces macrogynus ATCC 38327]|eukprot:KNE56751.1 hypothetical protein AMAG_02530 [Allomyces macrogynus ATCC 38327]